MPESRRAVQDAASTVHRPGYAQRPADYDVFVGAADAGRTIRQFTTDAVDSRLKPDPPPSTSVPADHRDDFVG
jgi:hypothetical protein